MGSSTFTVKRITRRSSWRHRCTTPCTPSSSTRWPRVTPHSRRAGRRLAVPPGNQSDGRLVVAARGVRAFAYGLMGVLLAVALSQRVFTPVGIGALLTVSLVGDFSGTYIGV